MVCNNGFPLFLWNKQIIDNSSLLIKKIKEDIEKEEYGEYSCTWTVDEENSTVTIYQGGDSAIFTYADDKLTTKFKNKTLVFVKE